MPKLKELANVVHSMPTQRYLNYMRSAQWKEVRAAHLRSVDYKCEICYVAPASQVHHVTYARLGNESSFDLCAVCIGCHLKLHNLVMPSPANDNNPQLDLFKTG